MSLTAHARTHVPAFLKYRPLSVDVRRGLTRGPSALQEAEAVFKQPEPATIPVVDVPEIGGTTMNAYPSAETAFLLTGDLVLSADNAAFIAAYCVHPQQSRIRPLDHPSAVEHIKSLSYIMATEGAWLPGTQLWFGVIDGRIWAMDGNHRVRAQAMAGVSVEWNIRIVEYDSEHEFLADFHKFNTNSRGRSEAQILNAAGLAERFSITKQSARALMAAVPFIAVKFRTGRSPRSNEELAKSRIVDVRLDEAARFGSEAKLFDECLKKADSRVKTKLLTAGVAAVALVTLKHQPKAAVEFWRGVARNDGLAKGDPRHTLVMDLLTRTMNHGSAHQNIAAPAAAWNAWLGGRKISHIKVVDTPAVKIAGTPYTGQ